MRSIEQLALFLYFFHRTITLLKHQLLGKRVLNLLSDRLIDSISSFLPSPPLNPSPFSSSNIPTVVIVTAGWRDHGGGDVSHSGRGLPARPRLLLPATAGVHQSGRLKQDNDAPGTDRPGR